MKIKYLFSIFFKTYTLVIIASIVFGSFPTLAAGVSTLHVVTNVINTNGQTSTASNFNVHVDGANANPGSFAGSSSGTDVTVDIGSPYSVSVNPGFSYAASLSPDCSSTLMAGGNATCTITLQDFPASQSGVVPPNIIQNPTFEVADPNNSSLPLGWLTGNFGTNTAQFVYPFTDASSSGAELSSGKAASINMSAYSSGDAKWYFNPVPVTVGRRYTFTDAYISNVPTELIFEFFDSNHVHLSYDGFITLPSTPAHVWMAGSGSFTVPVGASYATVFHTIASNGSLSVDNASLIEMPLPIPFSNGFVSLSFDDSLKSQFLSAKPILDTHNKKGTFYVISHVVSGLSIPNPSLETVDPSDPSKPLGWQKTGSASSTFLYPVTGHVGLAASVIASTTNSNVGWYFNPITVLPDNIYNYSGYYKSTGSSTLVAQFTNASGTIQNAEVFDVNGVDLNTDTIQIPPSGDIWTQTQAYFYVPPDVKTVSVLQRLVGVGSLTIDDVTFGVGEYMTLADLLNLQSDGQEIGAHTQSHKDLILVSPTQLISEISGGRQDLLSAGLSSILSFAYPYGNYNQSVEQVVSSSGLTSGRSVIPGYNGINTDKFGLLAQSVTSSTTLSQVESWIDAAKANRNWLVLVFHNVQNNLVDEPYGTTPAILDGILTYLDNTNVPVHTVGEGISLMSASPVPVTLAPIIGAVKVASSTDTSFTVNWTTDHNATSRVVFDTVSHSVASSSPNYNYASSTIENAAATTSHIVTVNNLLPATSYYFRVISHDSLESISSELVAITSSTTPTTTGTTTGATTSTTTDATSTSGGVPSGGNGGSSGSGGSGFTGGGVLYQNTSNIKSVGGGKRVSTSTIPDSGDILKNKNLLKPGQVLGATTFYFAKNLNLGMHSNDVVELQKRLRNGGFYSYPTNTGYFGSSTLAAVKAYQKYKHISSVGIVGPATRASLNK